MIINLYVILIISLKGLRYCITQHNLVERKIKTNNKYRKEIFNQIKDYMHTNKIDTIIIGSDQ